MIFEVSDIINFNKTIGQSGDLIDPNMLHSAFSSYHYYEDDVDKVSSIYRGIAKNHAFQDGNKRTATLFLLNALINSEKLDDNQLESLVLDVANNKHSVEQISDKIKHLKNYSGVYTIESE